MCDKKDMALAVEYIFPISVIIEFSNSMNALGMHCIRIRFIPSQRDKKITKVKTYLGLNVLLHGREM